MRLYHGFALQEYLQGTGVGREFNYRGILGSSQEVNSLRKQGVCFHLHEVAVTDQGGLHQGIGGLNACKALPMGSGNGLPIGCALHKNPRPHHILEAASKGSNNIQEVQVIDNVLNDLFQKI